jgi:hypothetical protein
MESRAMKVCCNYNKPKLIELIVTAIRHKLPLRNTNYPYDYIAQELMLSNSEIITSLGPAAEVILRRYLLHDQGINLDDRTYAATILIECIGTKDLAPIIDGLFTKHQRVEDKLLGLVLFRCGLGLNCNEAEVVGGTPESDKNKEEYASFLDELSREKSFMTEDNLKLDASFKIYGEMFDINDCSP